MTMALTLFLPILSYGNLSELAKFGIQTESEKMKLWAEDNLQNYVDNYKNKAFISLKVSRIWERLGYVADCKSEQERYLEYFSKQIKYQKEQSLIRWSSKNIGKELKALYKKRDEQINELEKDYKRYKANFEKSKIDKKSKNCKISFKPQTEILKSLYGE